MSQRLLWAVATGALLLWACGSDDDDRPRPPSGTGGTGGSVGGTGGTGGGGAGTGGSAAAAGSGGTAGDGGTTVPCDDPSDSTKAALCLALEPETIQFLPSNPAFDGKGVLFVEIFDTPTPALGATPIASQLLPAQDGGADAGFVEATLAQLTAAPIRFDGLSATDKLYARAIFVDNDAVLSAGAPLPGVWFAGIDLIDGIGGTPPLYELSLTAGEGTGIVRKLIALRKLSVTVSRASGVSPKGDGQGPLTFVAVDGVQVAPTTNIWGLGSALCGDLSGTSPFTVEGFVVGSGTKHLLAVLDDFGVGSAGLPAGAMTNGQVSGTTFTIPTGDSVSIPFDAYAVLANVELGTAFDGPDGGADNASCATPDAGADAGAGDASTD